MKLNFFLLSKSKEKTSIQAIVRYKGQRYVIAVGESIKVKHWNLTAHRSVFCFQSISKVPSGRSQFSKREDFRECCWKKLRTEELFFIAPQKKI
ncbi:MAG: hypothetical protein LBG15_01385 [Dysgonamonadaceae bacterium]|jgi:hypothetical protein|nr:hypothetical protein [Dysgonamonadaceae bacterium]